MDRKDLEDIFPIGSEFLSDGHIIVNGCDLQKLANDYGTPLYAYDARTLSANIDELQNALKAAYPGGSAVAYASKAYLSLRFARKLALMRDLELDVVSLGEMLMAKHAGIGAERVHFHGNNKSVVEIRTAIEWGVHSIVADNLEELEIIERIAAEKGRIARVWLRITPDIHVKTHPHIETSARDSKFGFHISSGEAKQGIIFARQSKSLILIGLHTHLGSQLFDAEPYGLALTMLLNLAADCDYQPEEISPGGGWGVRYTENDPVNDAKLWAERCAQTVTESCRKLGMQLPRLILEPGRFIVGRAGIALYHVGTRKSTLNGSSIAAVDGGMADNPRHALYEAKYTAVIAGKWNQPSHQLTRIVGKFCESGDTLIDEVPLPQLERGDVLVIPVSGAFQLSMASNYNLAPRPAVLWLENGRSEILQEQENPQENGWYI